MKHDALTEEDTYGEYAIWWTSQRNCEREFGRDYDLPETWPEYLLVEMNSRLGRNGRGRLWVNTEQFPDVQGIVWPEESAVAKIIMDDSRAGIWIWRNDLEHVIGLQGFVTDLNLNLIDLEEEDMWRNLNCVSVMALAADDV